MSRVLSEQQIQEAKILKLSGYTKRKLAEHFNVAQTTIWDNVFRPYSKRLPRIAPPKTKEIPKISRYKIIVYVVKLKKHEGYNSMDIANELKLPLSDVNYIYSMYHKTIK